MRRLVATIALAGVTSLGSPLAFGQSVQKLDYDTFCKLLDVQAKRTAFLATSAESRAELVRTQLERWREANRAKLSTKQVESLSQLIAAIGPETYSDGPKAEEQRIKTRALAEAQRELFTDAEIQAMQPYGPCIAKSK
jgi:hypothetical protein